MSKTPNPKPRAQVHGFDDPRLLSDRLVLVPVETLNWLASNAELMLHMASACPELARVFAMSAETRMHLTQDVMTARHAILSQQRPEHLGHRQ